jgi:hypothetical protein
MSFKLNNGFQVTALLALPRVAIESAMLFAELCVFLNASLVL